MTPTDLIRQIDAETLRHRARQLRRNHGAVISEANLQACHLLLDGASVMRDRADYEGALEKMKLAAATLLDEVATAERIIKAREGR